MDNEQDDQFLLSKIKLAESVATVYQKAHPRLDIDECLSEARGIAWQNSVDEIPSKVENGLRVMLRSVKRDDSRHISLERLAGCAEGEPLNSIRDLRAAPSLNPQACNSQGAALGRDYVDALRTVSDSAVVQNYADHPDHAAYGLAASLSRASVKDSLERRTQIVSNVLEFHGREELPLAA